MFSLTGRMGSYKNQNTCHLSLLSFSFLLHSELNYLIVSTSASLSLPLKCSSKNLFGAALRATWTGNVAGEQKFERSTSIHLRKDYNRDSWRLSKESDLNWWEKKTLTKTQIQKSFHRSNFRRHGANYYMKCLCNWNICFRLCFITWTISPTENKAIHIKFKISSVTVIKAILFFLNIVSSNFSCSPFR